MPETVTPNGLNPVTQGQIDRWMSGALIQRAMPNLTVAERELFLSGYCGNCFDRLFAEEDES